MLLFVSQKDTCYVLYIGSESLIPNAFSSFQYGDVHYKVVLASSSE